jgi:hypothetical protein
MSRLIPRRLSSQVWLFALPSALMSFERRRKVPQLPIGKARFAGIPLVAAGLGLMLWAYQRQGEPIHRSGPLARVRLAGKPSTAGGIIILAGVGLVARSAVLLAYAAGLIVASETDQINIDEANIESLVPHNR